MSMRLYAEGEHHDVREGDEGEVGIILSGHLFPLLLDAVQVVTKRLLEDSLVLASSTSTRSTSTR
jgi:hypothetical protein